MSDAKSGEVIPFQERPRTKAQRWAEHWSEALKNISEGSSLRQECEACGCDVSTAYVWIMAHPDRQRAYDLAYIILADGVADSIAGIAAKLVKEGRFMTAPEVQAHRVAMDALMWTASIRNNRKYGERKTVEIEQSIDPAKAREQLERLRKELAPVFATQEAKAKA